MIRASRRSRAVTNEPSAAAGAAPPTVAQCARQLGRLRVRGGDVVGPHLDQRGHRDLGADHPLHERGRRPPRDERQHHEVVAFPQVRALVGEHGDDLAGVERLRGCPPTARGGSACRAGSTPPGAAWSSTWAPGTAGHGVASTSSRSQWRRRARRVRDVVAAITPRSQQARPSPTASARRWSLPIASTAAGSTASTGSALRQVRPERGQAVDGARADERQPAGEPDRLPHQQRPDGVAGGPVGGGQGAADRFGEQPRRAPAAPPPRPPRRRCSQNAGPAQAVLNEQAERAGLTEQVAQARRAPPAGWSRRSGRARRSGRPRRRAPRSSARRRGPRGCRRRGSGGPARRARG